MGGGFIHTTEQNYEAGDNHLHYYSYLISNNVHHNWQAWCFAMCKQAWKKNVREPTAGHAVSSVRLQKRREQ